jgi:hypothetical protein
MSDEFIPPDISPRGHQHAGFVGLSGSRPPAFGARIQFYFGPLLGLPANLGFDELPGNLVTEGARQRLQIGKPGFVREATGIDLSSQFPGNLAQPDA